MPKNSIVLGMARSGTSMTAAIFARCGYFVAEKDNQLQEADKFNPSGYWEAEPFINANKEILSAVGFGCDNTWFRNAITEKQAADILKLQILPEHKKLISQFNLHSPWVWKDPRLCYTLGYWWPHLEQENTRVLFLHREPSEILSSFLRVKKSWYVDQSLSEADICNRIEQHLKAAKSTLEKFNIPYVNINYSDYSSDPDGVVNSVSDFFEVVLDKSDIGYNSKANHSSFRGKVSIVFERLISLIPHWIRRLIKQFVD